MDLLLSSEKADYKAVRHLLDSGSVTLSYVDSFGNNALHYALQHPAAVSAGVAMRSSASAGHNSFALAGSNVPGLGPSSASLVTGGGGGGGGGGGVSAGSGSGIFAHPH